MKNKKKVCVTLIVVASVAAFLVICSIDEPKRYIIQRRYQYKRH